MGELDALWMAAGLYTAAFLYGLGLLLRTRRYSRALMFTLVLVGFALQTSGLYLRGLQVGGCPLSTPMELIQFVVWSQVVVYLLVGPAFRMSLLGFFSSGLAAALSILSLAPGGLDEGPRMMSFASPWLEAHAALALFSYGVFAVLALTSLMYLLQSLGLQHKRTRGLFTFLPPIVQLEAMNRRLLFVGASVLTVSLLLGAVYWLGEPELVTTKKLLFTVALWVGYATVLGLRLGQWLVARRFAWTCVVLFLFALLTLWPVETSRVLVP